MELSENEKLKIGLICTTYFSIFLGLVFYFTMPLKILLESKRPFIGTLMFAFSIIGLLKVFIELIEPYHKISMEYREYMDSLED